MVPAAGSPRWALHRPAHERALQHSRCARRTVQRTCSEQLLETQQLVLGAKLVRDPGPGAWGPGAREPVRKGQGVVVHACYRHLASSWNSVLHFSSPSARRCRASRLDCSVASAPAAAWARCVGVWRGVPKWVAAVVVLCVLHDMAVVWVVSRMACGTVGVLIAVSAPGMYAQPVCGQ